MRYYTLDHLPRPKRAQLQNIVRLLVQATAVEMVILFGSHAYDDWVEDHTTGHISDYDILIIVESPSLAADHALWEELQEQARQLTGDTLVSFIVHNIEDINRRLEQGSDFFHEIKEDGIVLHDTGRHSLIGERSEAAARATSQPEARDRFDWDIKNADLWLAKFESDLRMVHLNHAAFELHQAAESYYKTVLRVLRGDVPKTHDLHALSGKCSHQHQAFRGIFPRESAIDKQRFRLLDRAYKEARYEMSYSITVEDLQILAGRVRILRERTESVCRDFLDSRGAAA